MVPRYLPLWSSKTETRLDMQRVLVRGISMSVNLCNSMRAVTRPRLITDTDGITCCWVERPCKERREANAVPVDSRAEHVMKNQPLSCQCGARDDGAWHPTVSVNGKMITLTCTCTVKRDWCHRYLGDGTLGARVREKYGWPRAGMGTWMRLFGSRSRSTPSVGSARII